MPARRPLVLLGGLKVELPVGDTVIGAGGGAGGPIASGTAIVDFGAGNDIASVTVADATIAAGASIQVWIAPIKSAAVDNREEDEQLAEPLRVMATTIVPGVSFALQAICDFGQAFGKFRLGWEHY
jgi:hypothetical protein